MRHSLLALVAVLRPVASLHLPHILGISGMSSEGRRRRRGGELPLWEIVTMLLHAQNRAVWCCETPVRFATIPGLLALVSNATDAASDFVV